MNRVAEIIDLKWAHSRQITGKNVGVAVLDTGVWMHPDFVNETGRIIGFKDILQDRKQMYDDNGHGTHVCGILGGNGVASKGKYIGVAPECNLIVVKVLNQKGNGNISDVIQGLKWVLDNRKKYNIRILNISVGTPAKKELEESSELVQAVNEVWDAGIIVVVAAGNNGPFPQTIGAPGNSRKVITVGASDDDLLVEMDGSKIKDYSSRGPTKECIIKPDIVAPGSNVVSCNGIKVSKNNMYSIKSGTSMATPAVSGAIALLLSVYPHMTGRDVKVRLKNSAVDCGFPMNQQGWGCLNIRRLLRLEEDNQRGTT